ncbi:uncharacterized protein [Rutidosis leptorrhynchoides]|uniref:uncharacterized protein isoform X2 n=1 Tax=Rutidosis leptorrhynchoides TaxID=125765 RepID=UPI003A98FCAE
MAPAAVINDSQANQKTVFIDTSLETHLATIVSDSDTVSDLRQKIMLEHHHLYPDIGDIRIECLKLKRGGVFYRLSDSTLIKSAFPSSKRSCYVSVDVSRLENDGCTLQQMKRYTSGDQLASPCVSSKNKAAEKEESSTSSIKKVHNTNVNANDSSQQDFVSVSVFDEKLNEQRTNENVISLFIEKRNEVFGTSGVDTTTSKKRKRRRHKSKKIILSSSDNIIKSCENTSSNCNKNTKVKEIIQVAKLGKKLIIFDLNGLLADIVSPRPNVFKRPFLDDFMCFCFERFNVGIWSSRSTKMLKPILDFLLGDLKNKLLFCWDGSKCTKTGIRTLEDKHKYLVLKDIKKIWETNGPRNSWVKGTFNESNTLLLDDSPYKALINPKHTGIFPVSYSYKNKDDNSLGPKGELRSYLEGLASTDNVKTYVKQHPFGQSPIDLNNRNWSFYSRVLKGRYR